jgi:glycosyltransferase involved in cell wall biosynthesis
VAFVEYFPPYLGSDRRIFELLRRMRSWRVVHIVVPPLRALVGNCESRLSSYLDENFIQGAATGKQGGQDNELFSPVYLKIPRVLRGLWRSSPHVAYPVTLLLLILRAWRVMARLRPSVVILAHPSYLCGLAGGIAAKLLRLPVLLDYPDAWTPLACETARLDPESLVGRSLALIERFVARLADGVTAVSEGVAAYARTIGVRAVINVIPNGVDTRLFDPSRYDAGKVRRAMGLSADEVVLVCAGRMDAWSGAEILSDRFSAIFRKFQCVRLLILGDGPIVDGLTRQGNESMNKGMIFLPAVAHEEVPKVIAASDIGLVLFRRTRATEYCIPIRILEYLALGKPVICSPLTGVRSVVCGGVIYSEDDSIESFLRSVEILLQQESLRVQLASEARGVALSLDWEVLSEAFAKAVQAVASAARGERMGEGDSASDGGVV